MAAKKQTYEQAMKRLEEIVSRIDSNELDIDSLGVNLKEAQELIKFCRDKLYKADEEIKHIENCTSQNAVKKQVKVNNYFFMDNQERFENVCLGYSIQAERLMKVIQKDTAGKITKDWVTPERKITIEQSSVIMETIQFQLMKLKQASGKYQKHIKNSVYCQQLLRPYISKLQKIIAEVDALIGTGDKHEREH